MLNLFKTRSYFFLCPVIFFALYACAGRQAANTTTNDDITLAVYYFPGYHTREAGDLPFDHRHPGDWTEWELVKTAAPRFPGHKQPNVPLWGYQDERNPTVMAKKIDAAADNGIDVFIFDWYYFNTGPFLNRALDEGFLGAENTDRLKFALMWANHTWCDIFPKTGGGIPETIHEGVVTPEVFDKIGDLVIDRYFSKSNYWTIDQKPYFSVYDVSSFVKSFGSIENTRKAMDAWDAKVVAAGFPGIHWNFIIGDPALVDESNFSRAELCHLLNVNSAASYMSFHQVDLNNLETDFPELTQRYLKYWFDHKTDLRIPYFYNVTKGFDPSPRTNRETEWDAAFGYPYFNTITNNTPENFRKALQQTRDTVLMHQDIPNIITIAAWNEWTEDCYLEPDTEYGMAYLEAIKDVFGK